MAKWAYLIETDSRVRAAERRWRASGNDEDLIVYVDMLKRHAQEVSDDLQSSYDDAIRNRDQNAEKYDSINKAQAVLRKRPRNPGVRFARIKAAFKKEQSEENADDLVAEYEIAKGRKDKEISRHCNLQGHMGSFCNQANQIEITTRYYIILVSYQTPVAYRLRSTGEEFVTDMRHSRTTNRHIRRWTGTTATEVPQAEIDDIYRNI